MCPAKKCGRILAIVVSRPKSMRPVCLSSVANSCRDADLAQGGFWCRLSAPSTISILALGQNSRQSSFDCANVPAPCGGRRTVG